MSDNKKPHPHSPKGIDWAAAKAYYLANASRSYKDVSEHYGVSMTMVEKHGSAEEWVAARRVLGERALKEFEDSKINYIADANKNHLNIWRAMLSTATKRLRDNAGDLSTTQLKNIAQVLKEAINGERVVLGLPTAVSKQEIDAVINPEKRLEEILLRVYDEQPSNTKPQDESSTGG